MAKLGRPSDYTPELGALICDQMAEGTSLKDICADDSMPKVSTIGHWRAKHPEFAALYAHARQLAGDAEADNAKRFAETTHVMLPNGMWAPIDAQRARLMADTAKWRSSRLNSKDWGDKTQIEHSGSITFVDMTDDELAAEVLDLISSGRLTLPGGARLVLTEDTPPEPDEDDFDHESLA